MPDLHLTSAANPRVKQLLALRRRRERDAAGQTLVEGADELAMALAGGARLLALYSCPELYRPGGDAGRNSPSGDGSQHDLVAAARAGGVPVVRLSRAVFQKVAYREGPDGLLAVAAMPQHDLATLTVPAEPLVLLVERVEKPGNLGAMLRTADAVGAHAVVCADPVTDWGNPNVVRSSKGTVFTVPLASAGLDAVLGWCRRHGIRLVVTTPQATLLHTEADLGGPVAVAVGGEKHGASEALLAAADLRVRIPMAGRADSLNVAAAAAVVLFEAVRQRPAGSNRLQDQPRAEGLRSGQGHV